jgi:hypothetical protein
LKRKMKEMVGNRKKKGGIRNVGDEHVMKETKYAAHASTKKKIKYIRTQLMTCTFCMLRETS